MSDPAVKDMTMTQWTFELASLVEQDKRKYDDIYSIMKSSRKALYSKVYSDAINLAT